MRYPGLDCLCKIACTLAVSFSFVQIGYGQEPFWSEPDQFVSSEQQLLLEQIDELLISNQDSEAMGLIDRLVDQPPALVLFGQVQHASTQQVQVFHTLQELCRLKLNVAISRDFKLANDYRQQRNPQGEAAYRALQLSKEYRHGRQLLDRFHATDSGPKLSRLLVDVLLEKNQGLAGLMVLDDYFTDFTRIDLSIISEQSPALLVPWYRAWQYLQGNKSGSERLVELWRARTSQQPELTVDVVSRQMIAAAMHPDNYDLEAVTQWAVCVIQQIQEPSHARKLQAVLDSVRDGPDKSTSNSAKDFNLDRWPDWQVPVERYSNSYDLTPATHPRVSQRESMLPLTPTIHEGKVFLHELTRIRAFSLETGLSWPTSINEQALFDSQTAPEAHIPLGYPVMGMPQGKVTVEENCLYARMGTPVTGWANRIRASDGSSISYLIGLDLDSQGKMLQGFPRQLLNAELENAEFEGCPVICGRKLIATVTQRDQANLRRRLVALDRFSGKLLWISQVLASGSVVGSHRANLISHAQPVAIGGLIYFLSDLGTVACLDAHTGRTHWVTNYQRTIDQPADYPRPNRFRYRDGNACRVHHGLVYCLPQDCPELFALDALTGDLVWSSNEIDVADCTHLVGVQGKSVVVCGDRVVWLDGKNGRVLGGFSEFTTPGTVNSLPQPRGLGQATLVGDRVYWPTSSAVFVFEADMADAIHSKTHSAGSPILIKRYNTGARGAEGGNLVTQNGRLLMATPGRLYCFRSE